MYMSKYDILFKYFSPINHRHVYKNIKTCDMFAHSIGDSAKIFLNLIRVSFFFQSIKRSVKIQSKYFNSFQLFFVILSYSMFKNDSTTYKHMYAAALVRIFSYKNFAKK